MNRQQQQDDEESDSSSDDSVKNYKKCEIQDLTQWKKKNGYE